MDIDRPLHYFSSFRVVPYLKYGLDNSFSLILNKDWSKMTSRSDPRAEIVSKWNIQMKFPNRISKQKNFNFVWKFCLEIPFGNSVWKFHLEISFGNSVWKFCFEIFVWKFCFGRQRDRPTTTTKSTANFNTKPQASECSDSYKTSK